MAAATPPITNADQLLQATGLGRCELVRGELIMMSPAGGAHGRIAMEIGGLLRDFIRRHRLGRVYAAETGFLLGRNPDTLRAPDVAYLSAARADAERPRGFIEGPPDLAVEVLSPDDRPTEVEEKVRDWLAAGTIEVWVVAPDRQTISVHRTGRPPVVLGSDDEYSGGKVLPGFSLRVADVFAT